LPKKHKDLVLLKNDLDRKFGDDVAKYQEFYADKTDAAQKRLTFWEMSADELIDEYREIGGKLTMR